MGQVFLMLSKFMVVLGALQVRSARRRLVMSNVMDNPTGVEVRIGREVASLLPSAPAVRCRGSVSRPTQVSSVLFPVGIRFSHFQQRGRTSLPYRSGQTMCRKPHQESGPTGTTLFQTEVTQQGTEHNAMRPAW